MKILVLGGYGNFGARICRALAGDAAITLWIAGRDGRRAQALADALGGAAAGVYAAAVDHHVGDFAQRLRALGIELLIHAAGPFQAQGYAVAQATAQAGAHYIDLADGRRFVCDFAAAMDPAFRATGRSAICGASTVPALSSAIVDGLCQGWQGIDSIDICIAPAQTAPRGVATLAAVLSYCGEPIPVWHGGRWQALPGWARPVPVAFARMPHRLGALCDIPDLELFPQRYAVAQRVMFRAALEVRFTQQVFATLAHWRAAGCLPPLARLAPLLNAVAPLLDGFGSACGGMVLRVRGVVGAGRGRACAWHITADNDHGPEIPCMAAILLARRLAHGGALPLGAQACLGLLTLDDFAPEFERWGMVVEVIEERMECRADNELATRQDVGAVPGSAAAPAKSSTAIPP